MSSCDLIKRVHQQTHEHTHSVWIKAQVSLFKAVIMSKVILFRSTAFLIRDISVFKKDIFGWLSFKAC